MSAEFAPLTTTVQAMSSPLLAVLPNGEAVRASLVRSVTIEELPGLVGQEDTRFRVVVEMEDGTRRAVATDLAATDATDLARRTGRAINDILRMP
jgi:hypothetical protein